MSENPTAAGNPETGHPDTNVRVVCFDLGGVLIRIHRTWSSACHAVGLDVRSDDIDRRFADIGAPIVEDYQTGRLTGDEFAAALSAGIDGLYTPEEVDRVHRAWTIDEYPGAAALVQQLNAAGVHTACLSNTNAAHWDMLSDIPTIARLITPLASHLMGLHKPDRAIYEVAEAAFGGPRGREIIFFDDLPENVEAARAYGWRSEQIDHDVHCTAEQILAHLTRHGVRTD